MIKYSQDDKHAMEQLIEACDLTSKTSARSGTLSGGQKRKLQLACMLVGGSTVCLLDEVSSGLVSITFLPQDNMSDNKVGSPFPTQNLEYYSRRTKQTNNDSHYPLS